MDIETDLADNIKACRTCGIHYVTPSKYQLKHLFQSCQDHSEIQLIRLELAQWNIEVAENDGFPQYVCNTCIHKFEQVFQLRTACINAQNEFRKFYAVPNGNIPNIKIKSEMPDTNDEPSICDFIYVDELSDGEYDGATPFNIPHIPIKEEVIEAATVPKEESEQNIRMVESASRIVMSTDSSSARENEFVSQNDSGAANVADAALPITVDPVECNLCHQICSTEEERKQHLQVVHDITDLECQICGKEFKNSTSARLRFHMKWHSLNKQIRCNLCSFVCSSKDVLSMHRRANHRKLTCKVCGKGILAKKMKSHLQQHELQQKYSCEYCAKDFATEDERESHIWQIHANEDNNATSSLINFGTSFTQPPNDESSSVQNEENVGQEPQEDILYKFICAHCEHRFMEQIDLETHVNEEHRGNHSVLETKSATSVDAVINETTFETPQNETNVNETTTLENNNDNEIQVTNNDHMINSSVAAQDSTIPTASSSAASQNENQQNDDTELALYSSSEEDSEETHSEEETSSNISTYVDSNLKPFACAKCSETFAVIEQLRDHHEQHLAAEQDQQKKRTATKSKFQCNLCGKYFDLKFRLNRHFNKHKNHPPL